MKPQFRLLKASPLLILVLILSICSQNVSAQPGVSWTYRASAADNSWTSVTYGNGLFVAVANSGTGNRVMTSSDGFTWTSRVSAADNSWTSVTYGNGLFVAVANSGTGNRVMTSSDGFTWTSRVPAVDNTWTSVTYGNGLFVAVAGNQVMTSPDGITWTFHASAASNSWTSVTYGNGLFVAVSSSGTGNRVMTSSDGFTWISRVSADDRSWRAVTYGNGLFVAISSSAISNWVMTSPDGITWTAYSIIAGFFRSITYANGLFVAVANGGDVSISSDGTTWTYGPWTANNWNAITYSNGLFVAVASTGTGNRVMTSSSPATGLDFDGVDDFVSSGNILTPSYTKEAWINISNLTLSNNIISGGTDGQHAFWATSGYGNRLSAGHNGSWDATQDPTPLLANTWYHVAVTYDASTTTMRLYKNGSLVSTNTSVPAYASGNAVRIGSYAGATNLFGGSMDEVRIWNRALCAAEISNNYTGEIPVASQTGLVLSYSFNQGLVGSPNSAITTATDGSGNANTGTLNGFALTGVTSNWVLGTVTTTASVYTAATLAGTTGGPTITYTANVIPAGSSYIADDCGLIARVLPSGGSPVAGNITSKVKIDATVQTYNTSPYVQRHYDIEPATNAATATGTITLYFTQAEFTAYNTARGGLPALPTGTADAAGKANLRVTQYHGTGTAPGNYTGTSELIDPVDANIIWNATNSRWEVTFNIVGFSGFYVHTTTGGTLPVSLINFSGNNNGNINQLQWTTTAEQNSDRFELERSINGISFSAVATLTAQGNSSSTRQYQNNDNITGINSTVFYYRLKMIDQDGNFKYSAVVKINIANKGFTVDVTPNPFSNGTQVNISALNQEQATLRLMNSAGQQVMQQTIQLQKGNNAMLLPQADMLTRGLYYVQIQTATQMQTIKVVKQ